MTGNTILRKEGAKPEAGTHPLLRHSVFAWLGIRPVLGQHTLGEHEALRKWATGRSRLVEIGVAEGASAVALREAMSPEGTLWLIDPFHLSRVRAINATRRAAHRAVRGCRNGRVIWIEEFSSNAAKDWSGPIDFLFIDGDHSETGVQQDWGKVASTYDAGWGGCFPRRSHVCRWMDSAGLGSGEACQSTFSGAGPSWVEYCAGG